MKRMRWLIFILFVFLATFSTKLSNAIPKKTAPKLTKHIKIVSSQYKYGECVTLPVFMFHHVQPNEIAKIKDQLPLTTNVTLFKEYLNHLKDEGYTSILPDDLINFFDENKKIPDKSMMLTFDDGYEDNYKYAFPILKEFGYKGVMFLPTGLIGTEGYLTWDEVLEMNASESVVFANHTWSHMSVEKNEELVRKEITTADQDLERKNLDGSKTFAYPYGETNGVTEKLLDQMGYKLAFTTEYGEKLCRNKRLELPRVRAYHIPSF